VSKATRPSKLNSPHHCNEHIGVYNSGEVSMCLWLSNNPLRWRGSVSKANGAEVILCKMKRDDLTVPFLFQESVTPTAN